MPSARLFRTEFYPSTVDNFALSRRTELVIIEAIIDCSVKQRHFPFGLDQGPIDRSWARPVFLWMDLHQAISKFAFRTSNEPFVRVVPGGLGTGVVQCLWHLNVTLRIILRELIKECRCNRM